MADIANVPHRGQLLRDYELKKADASSLTLSDFRNKQNLVLILLPPAIEPRQTQLIASLAEKSAEVRENETRVIVVVRPEQLARVAELSEVLTAAVDESGRMFAELCGADATTIYFTDKFREVFHVFHIAGGDPLPTTDDILGWIKFVAMQCPECHPPEWPADAL